MYVPSSIFADVHPESSRSLPDNENCHYYRRERCKQAFFQPDGALFPTIVLEMGCNESFTSLRDDKDLWLLGNPITQVVILIKWSRLAQNKVKGDLEHWIRGAEGPTLVFDTAVFLPPPSPMPAVDAIEFPKVQLFRAFLPQGTSPNIRLEIGPKEKSGKWDLSLLRNCFPGFVSVEKAYMHPLVLHMLGAGVMREMEAFKLQTK